jgi:hypothetical protein
VPEHGRRPHHEVADIFRAHGEAYRATHPLTPQQRKVMWCVEACRTSILGGHLDVCEHCAHEEPSYNSCRNRHCPKGQALDQARWLERRRERILPVNYFHVVFTLPGELRPLAARNRKLIYDLLFKTAAQTLLQLGRDPKRLGAVLGITAVLHTWTRDLRFHPHLHCVVTGGGLATDGERWIDSGGKFLFPVKVISKLFSGKLIAALERLHQRGGLVHSDIEDPHCAFATLRNKLFAKKWVVYAKRPFAGPEQVFSYLGRYTHRVAISNRRLLSVTDDTVTVATRGDKTATVHPLEFIRRFLMHVLPKDFVKIRHYGLMASSNVKTRLQVARRLLAPRLEDECATGDAHGTVSEDWRELLEDLTGIDPSICPACGSTQRRRVVVPATRSGVPSHARAPPDRGGR